MTIDDLYSGPAEDFIARRNELVRALQEAGEADEAKRVKGLRKPTAAATALNHLVRQRPELVEELAAAHREIRTAGSAEELRAAAQARASAIEVIVAAPDVSDSVRKQIRNTLLAAATDMEAESRLLSGQLERELEPAELGGFGLGLAIEPDAPAHPSAERAGGSKTQDRVAKLEREAGEREREAVALRRDAERALALAVAAEDRAAKARNRADEARRALER